MDSKFFERYAELCKEKGETPNSVAKEIGASSGSVTAWKNGAEPRNKTLGKIADYFKVSTDYLLGKEEKAPTDEGERKDVLDEVDIAFYGEYKELTEEQKATIRDMVAVMRKRRATER